MKAQARSKKSQPKIQVIDGTPGSERHTGKKSELEILKSQILRGSAEIGARFYELGCAFRLVRDGELWKVEKAKSFSAWIEGLKVYTRMTAYNMIAVAESMTRDQAVLYGPSLCYVIARATDDEARKELRTLADKGATASELRIVAREQRKEQGVKPKSPGRPKIVRSLTVVSGNGQVEKVSVDRQALKKSKQAENIEKGTVRLESKNGHLIGSFKACGTRVQVTIQVTSQGGKLDYSAR